MSTTVNISSYSGSVSAGDWGPAILAAVADIAATGGTINIDTDIDILSQVNITPSGNYYSIKFAGNGGNSISIHCGYGLAAFNLGNLNNVTFSDITFLGDTGTSGSVNCTWVMLIAGTQKALIDRCVFVGLYAYSSLILAAAASDVIVRDCKFGGCGAIDAHIVGNGTNGLAVHGCEFFDYQNYLTGYYDRQQLRNHWIQALSPPANDSASNGYIDIQRCRFDEGAAQFVNIANYPRVRIEQCSGNHNGTASGYGFVLDGVENALLRQNFSGFHNADRPAVALTNCGYVMIDQMTMGQGPHPVEIDDLTRFTSITNSPDATVAPTSGATYSLNGVTYKGAVAQVG